MRVIVSITETRPNPKAAQEDQPALLQRTSWFKYEAAAQFVTHEVSGESLLVGEILSLLRSLTHIWGTLDHCQTVVWVPGVKAVIKVTAPYTHDNCSPVQALEALQLQYPVPSKAQRVLQLAAA